MSSHPAVGPGIMSVLFTEPVVGSKTFTNLLLLLATAVQIQS